MHTCNVFHMTLITVEWGWLLNRGVCLKPGHHNGDVDGFCASGTVNWSVGWLSGGGDYSNTHHRSNVWKPGWKQADTCKMFMLWQNFADSCLQKVLPFLDFANSRPLWKRIPRFRYEHGCTLWSGGCGGWVGVGVGIFNAHQWARSSDVNPQVLSSVERIRIASMENVCANDTGQLESYSRGTRR